MENKTLSLTDEIYHELVEGLKRGLNWTAFIAKYNASKGPLYNAIARFLRNMEPKVQEFNEVQGKLDAAGLKLDQLDRQIKEAESGLAPLEEKSNALNEGIETLETKLTEKSELLKHAGELGKLGFDTERLKQLQDALREIGAKHGLKGKEAVSRFFAELKDYDAKTGFEREIQRLETITETKKLQAEKWQAEADSLSRRHKDLSEVITAVQSLTKHGVKAEQIASWNGIVSRLGGPEELQDKLEQYKSMSELLTAKRKEVEDGDKKVTELSAQVKALNEQKVGIEGAIKSLSSSGVKKINEVGDKAVIGLRSLSTSGEKEITKVSDKAITGLKSLLEEMEKETKRLGDLRAKAGKLEKELMYARYLTTGDQSVLKSFPKEIVITFLDRASVYCKLNQLNPLVRVPDGLSRKYSSIYSSTEVGLLDLITWAEAGLAGASQ